MNETGERSASPPPPPPPDAQPAKKSNTGLIIAICVAGVFMLLVCLGLVAAIFVPALGRAREMARHAVELTNVRGLVQTMHVYAGQNNDVFPPHPGMLIADGSAAPEMFDSAITPGTPSVVYSGQIPAANTNLKFGEYFFVYNWQHGALTPPDHPLVFGPSLNGEGRSVGFGDGHAEFMVESDFEAMIGRVNAARATDPNLGAEIDLDGLGAR